VVDFSDVPSAASLKLALDRIVVRTKFQGAQVAEQLDALTKLEKLFGTRWGTSGDVAELFGDAFVEAGDVENGLRWYERAVAAQDGRASMRAAEQLANVRGRLAWEVVHNAARHLDEMRRNEKAPGRTSKARTAARRARLDAQRSLQQAVKRADRLIQEALALLTRLIGIEKTMERTSLIGSVYKRKALIDGATGRQARLQRDLRQMNAQYKNAQILGQKSGASNLYYPASNRLAADAALNAGTGRWRSLDRETATIVRKTLQARSASDPDFWSVVGETELDQYEAMAGKRLAAVHKQQERAYEDLHKRVTATRMWASVYDTACLVLPNYASRAKGRERAAAQALLAQLRKFAHPEEDQDLSRRNAAISR
jgi:hypothetical protein